MKPSGENGILFTYEHFLLRLSEWSLQLQSPTPELDYSEEQLRTVIDYVTRNGDISYFDGKGTWSHDNHTALTSASYMLDLDLHKKYLWKQWWRRVHPRDVGYYLYLYLSSNLPKLGVISTLLKVLLIPTQIAMIVACYQEYKVRNDVKILKTDGKLLSWVRFNTIPMRLTEKICTWLIKRNPKFGSWKKVFGIYFGKDHPSSNFDDEVYGD
jgi:hypothetical protein